MKNDAIPADAQVYVVGDGDFGIDELVAVARSRARVRLSETPAFRARLATSARALHAAIERGEPVYGVTTGYGGSCGNRVDPRDIEALGVNLIRYHGCGTGAPLPIAETRAAMLCRLLCLARGYSGITPDLLERLTAFLNLGITPCVPSEGSVGASGDLTPMSYIAAALAGEREVVYRGRRMPAAEALAAAGLPPYRFAPKEPLAMLNGTSVMTGIAALAVWRSRGLLAAAMEATALAVHGLSGNAGHFHETIFDAKPFAGQGRVAARLRELLAATGAAPRCDDPFALQDPYSLRCAPQILGVLADALTWIERWVEIEANGVNDNPLLDPATGAVLTGGNFYGGHIALAMDTLKAALASVADMADRQIALVVDGRFNRGLPGNLAPANDGDCALHHGFKGMQITASALTAEMQKNAMPAAVFSRSTETHNQDKVSLGTIAARDAARQCELGARVAAIHWLAAAQACRLRGGVAVRPALGPLADWALAQAGLDDGDRPMDATIERLAQAILDLAL